jgi:hypothetical protein
MFRTGLLRINGTDFLDADFAGCAEIFRHGLTLLFFATEDPSTALRAGYESAEKRKSK